MKGTVRIGAILLACAALPAGAVQFTLPVNARQTASRDSVLDQVAIAIAPYADSTLPTRTVEGAVTRRAYRITSPGLTPLQILAPLRAQLDAGGYDIVLDCDNRLCGGFDFRFGIDVLPAPNMYVNIRDYHYVSARHADTGAMISVLASAATGAAYLQIIQVGDTDQPAPVVAGAPVVPVVAGPDIPDIDTPPVATTEGLEQALLTTGSVVLRSIDFAVGTTTLGDAPAPELSAIAALMQARPGLSIAVVGHTDTVGGLATNITVSRARARAVRSALIETYGVPAARIEAEGMGYLSPIASNLTAEGREANRRVEVIVVREDE